MLRPYQEQAVSAVYRHLRDRDDSPVVVCRTGGGNPRLRVIGLTATPFRLKDGPICTPDGFLNHICHEVGVRELIVEGFLSPLVTKAGRVKADTSQLHVRGGEFVASEVEDLMDDDSLVVSACDEIVEHTRDRQAVLIFASGVRHGEHIVRVLAERHSIERGFVTGATPSRERDQTLARFQAGELRFMTNIDVLSTGFDAPHIDCVALAPRTPARTSRITAPRRAASAELWASLSGSSSPPIGSAEACGPVPAGDSATTPGTDPSASASGLTSTMRCGEASS